MDTETEIRDAATRNSWGHQKGEEAWKGPPRGFRRSMALRHLDFRFLTSRAVRQYILLL